MGSRRIKVRVTALREDCFVSHSGASEERLIVHWKLTLESTHMNTKARSYAWYELHETKYEQEDAHEFLRHLLDKMVDGCLKRRSVKSSAPNRLAETTPINRIFGGYLRSQVWYDTCRIKGRKSWQPCRVSIFAHNFFFDAARCVRCTGSVLVRAIRVSVSCFAVVPKSEL